MKPRTYVIVVALLLAAIFFLLPRARNSPEPPTADHPKPRTTGDFRAPAVSSQRFSRDEAGDGSRFDTRVPEVAEIEVTPESPPEQSVEWQITRQQAMLKALQRHLEATESRWRTANRELDRDTLEHQIDVLRSELTNQQAELSRLEELRSLGQPPAAEAGQGPSWETEND